jgi:hypothetical protein
MKQASSSSRRMAEGLASVYGSHSIGADRNKCARQKAAIDNAWHPYQSIARCLIWLSLAFTVSAVYSTAFAD